MTGPVPPYNNPPIHPEYFQPSNFTISSITSLTTTTTQVETLVTNNYVVGQLVRFHIPNGYGILQLNGLSAYVLSLTSPTIFVVDIGITNFDPFVTPSPPLSYQNPQVSAIGDHNFGKGQLLGATYEQLTIQGAFQNISP